MLEEAPTAAVEPEETSMAANSSRKLPPPPRSLPPLSFGDPDLDEPPVVANDAPHTAASLALRHTSIAPALAPPSPAEALRESIPTLTFSAPPSPPTVAPAEAVARASATPAMPGSTDVAALLNAIPSVPPANDPDPSFAAPAAPSNPPPRSSVVLPPLKPPPPAPRAWHVRARERLDTLTDRAVARMPDWPQSIHNLPVAVVYALALVLFWLQVGGAVRAVRNLVSLSVTLFE